MIFSTSSLAEGKRQYWYRYRYQQMLPAVISDANMWYGAIPSQWTVRDTAERDVPQRRLGDDTDLMKVYIFGRKLGQGSFGVVYEATHTETKTKWAIKMIRKPEPGSSQVRMLEQEIHILRQVNHTHIIELKEVYETAKMTYLVTELCVGGELKQLLQRKMFFPEDEARHIIYSLADAVAYLHKRDIVHRDLKLENILVKNSLEDDDGMINIKVADFGSATNTIRGGFGINNMMTEICGTLICMAPEMMSGHGYSCWCDVWSIGIIMYMLLCGEPPFVSKTQTALLKEILQDKVRYTQPIWATVSDAAKELMTVLLKTEPAYRMSAHQLRETRWVTGDPNMTALPVNALELMRLHREEEENAQALENVPLSSSEDTRDPSPVPGTASTETARNCRSYIKLSPRRRDKCCTLTKLSKEDGGGQQQERSKNVSKRPSQPITSQTHAGVKPCRQLSAQQPRSQEKRVRFPMWKY